MISFCFLMAGPSMRWCAARDISQSTSSEIFWTGSHLRPKYLRIRFSEPSPEGTYFLMLFSFRFLEIVLPHPHLAPPKRGYFSGPMLLGQSFSCLWRCSSDIVVSPFCLRYPCSFPSQTVFSPRDVLEREIWKDQASLAAKCLTENALREGMPDCESRCLLDRRATSRKRYFLRSQKGAFHRNSQNAHIQAQQKYFEKSTGELWLRANTTARKHLGFLFLS